MLKALQFDTENELHHFMLELFKDEDGVLTSSQNMTNETLKALEVENVHLLHKLFDELFSTSIEIPSSQNMVSLF